jgi:hypothetical protein
MSSVGWTERPDWGPHDGGTGYLFDESGRLCLLRTTLANDVAPSKTGAHRRSWLWQEGQLYRIHDTEISVPPITETLFAVCVAHARVASEPNVQWIVDAKMAMTAAVDWERFIVLADETAQVPRVRDVLDYLAGLPGPTPPAEIRDRLHAIPVTTRLRFSHLCTSGAVRGPARAWAIVGEHLATSAHRSPVGVIAAFPGFLRDRWGLTGTWQLPAALGKRAVRSLGDRQSAA